MLEDDLREVRERLRTSERGASELGAQLVSATEQVAALTADKQQLLARIDTYNEQHSTLYA